ncbi:MAG: cytochrome c biogenesis protein CcdA [Anaerolineales bacterium]|jgi:cytochrome c-type biogenesis protein|nr:cytochrome c biogenesis protein CcdA [Anaerolineales bacterium]MDX9936964.1 cytochrome c biogenesis protein CcdA [Anaerolineales bacterium]GER79615.1 cytochrome C biogenesis protein [Candidatus Denitrolinea symbiosum]HPP62657.1 cytochrome c biogenesis protein CcdA [Anaerolineales bacterium]
MDISNITIGLALLAGLASFLSPCVFSLVPAYIGYLGGRAAGGEGGENNRWTTFAHGLAFVLGFSVVFIFLGLAASVAGAFLYDLRVWLAKIGGLIVIVFGLHMIGIFRIPFLEYDVRVHTLPDPKLRYLSSALMGVFFSAGWAPCVGPVLGAILTLALNGGDLILGGKLLTAYSAGLAIPFLAAALGIGWVSNILRKHARVMRYVEIGMGVILVVIGGMLFTGVFALIAQRGQFFWIDFGL